MDTFLPLIVEFLVKFQGSVWFQVVSTIVTSTTAILMLWKMPEQGSIGWYVRKVFEFLSGNVFNAKKATTDKE